MLGARGIEVHICNFWPQWGVSMWGLLTAGRYVEAQRQLVDVVLPFMRLWGEIENSPSVARQRSNAMLKSRDQA